MKRLLLTGLLFLGLGQLSSFAQSGGSYTDDIYYSSEDAKKEAALPADWLVQLLHCRC